MKTIKNLQFEMKWVYFFIWENYYRITNLKAWMIFILNSNKLGLMFFNTHFFNQVKSIIIKKNLKSFVGLYNILFLTRSFDGTKINFSLLSSFANNLT